MCSNWKSLPSSRTGRGPPSTNTAECSKNGAPLAPRTSFTVSCSPAWAKHTDQLQPIGRTRSPSRFVGSPAAPSAEAGEHHVVALLGQGLLQVAHGDLRHREPGSEHLLDAPLEEAVRQISRGHRQPRFFPFSLDLVQIDRGERTGSRERGPRRVSPELVRRALAEDQPEHDPPGLRNHLHHDGEEPDFGFDQQDRNEHPCSSYVVW